MKKSEKATQIINVCREMVDYHQGEAESVFDNCVRQLEELRKKKLTQQEKDVMFDYIWNKINSPMAREFLGELAMLEGEE